MPVRKVPGLAVVEAESDAQVGATSVEKIEASDGAGDVSFDNREIARQKSDFQRMRDALRRQSKVRIRVHQETTVQLNGYTFQIAPKVWVEVPQQVADILEESGRI